MNKTEISSIQQEQVKALVNNAFTANIGITIAVLIVYGALFFDDADIYSSLICISILLTAVIRTVLASDFLNSTTPNYNRFLKLYSLLTLCLGLGWGLLTVLFHNSLPFEQRMFLTIVNMGLVSAAVGTLASNMRVYMAFVVPQVTAVVVMYFLSGNPYIGASMLVFSFVMMMVASRSNQEFSQSRELIQENQSLIDDMKNYQQELEAEVRVRTSELQLKNEDLHDQMIRREQIEQELENLAYYDVLTGLPNRTLLIDRLRKAISMAVRNETLFGVLFIDLDRFKSFNDTLGHDVGDVILQDVANRLRTLLRDSDTIARNGGDEFVVVIESVRDVHEVFIVAEKIIAALTRTFEIENHTVHIGASIGIALYPLDDNVPQELLKMADTAMYCAKKAGGGQFEFYSSSMSSQIRDRIELENRLRMALDKDDFYLMYQPQVDCNSGETTGFEALVRWQDKEMGLVSPDRFVPVLEESGLIYEVGDWIIEQAVKFIASGKVGDKTISVNLSALQCTVPSLGQKIDGIIKRYNINPSQLEFEITETVLINNLEKAERFLNELNEIGCSIALDDFGTGYTSMSYLARLPIDVIKIDRSMVSNIDSNENLVKIVRAIVTMSQSLGIKNVFEGIETEAELNTIRNLNGRIIQGYYYSKPLAVDQIEQWLDGTIQSLNTGKKAP